MDANTSQTDTKIVSRKMCFYCFESLREHLEKSGSKDSELIGQTIVNDAYPLFVTWYIGPDKRLRGCIGTFNPLPLRKGLKDYAIESATNDSRFNPISLNELPSLQVGISLLKDFEDAKDYMDWQLDIHGILISFTDGNRKRSATYLPNVATEAGWNKMQTLEHLINKSGYTGPLTDKLFKSISLRRYKSEKLELSYQDYADWKKTQ